MALDLVPVIRKRFGLRKTTPPEVIHLRAKAQGGQWLICHTTPGVVTTLFTWNQKMGEQNCPPPKQLKMDLNLCCSLISLLIFLIQAWISS